MKDPLRIVFIGTSEFGIPALEKIQTFPTYKLVGIVTIADKHAGRGRKLMSSPIKKWALSKSIPLLEVTHLKEVSFIQALKNLSPDLQIVIAFRILPKEIWNIPPLGTFNLHASLLPHYRGAAPINHALINGEKQTGITTFMLNEQVDQGDILLQESIPISEYQTAGELYQILSIMGGDLVIRTIEGLLDKTLTTNKQNIKEGFKKAPKITSKYAQLDWNNSLEDIYNKIRGLSPSPGAWTYLYFNEKEKDIRMKLFFGEKILLSHDHKPGSIQVDFTNFHMRIALKIGYLSIIEAQIEGKSRMKIKNLINGFNKKPPLYAY